MDFINKAVRCALLLVGALPPTAIAVSNSQIVESVSQSPLYLNGQFEMSDRSIIELPHYYEGSSLQYCTPVTVRAKADIKSKKVTSVNQGNHDEFRFEASIDSPGWADVIRNGKRIGYAAQAIEKESGISNILCKKSNYLSSSTIKVNDKEFNAELKNKRELVIRDKDNRVVYERTISGNTSLYELSNDSGLFGWVVGWNKYDDNPREYLKDLDFSVVRVLVPFVNKEGEAEVWDGVYPGIKQHKFRRSVIQDGDSFTLVANSTVYGPSFYWCTACMGYYDFPVFVNIKRHGGEIVETVSNKSVLIVNDEQISQAERFMHNWKYWNPKELNKMLMGKLGLDMRYIAHQCELPEFSGDYLPRLPRWNWTHHLTWVLDDSENTDTLVEDLNGNYLGVDEFSNYQKETEDSYLPVVDAVWEELWQADKERSARFLADTTGYAGGPASAYMYAAYDCLEENGDLDLIDTVRYVVGYLNLPLDINLISAVMDSHE